MKCTYEGFDYRKIPQQDLNSNIPKGRGMIKWAPFKTMPEQYERVSYMIEEQAKSDPPTLDNETIVMLEEQLKRNIGESVLLRYWNDGYEVFIECKLEYIDNRTGIIIVSKEKELLHIKFEHIYEII
ncbi:YolD-like family protein [Salinicoccus kekensis]|uniref:YolD-like protein n=1 Tax=Salinicoccus kekensis TaxID=714307 RepID=A0A285UTC0_9STAP|nr:YolD-like family protein [Salinicoccus kekensis]SOC45114.1 YolD-like protein [Salinicoccus kekensis]